MPNFTERCLIFEYVVFAGSQCLLNFLRRHAFLGEPAKSRGRVSRVPINKQNGRNASQQQPWQAACNFCDEKRTWMVYVARNFLGMCALTGSMFGVMQTEGVRFATRQFFGYLCSKRFNCPRGWSIWQPTLLLGYLCSKRFNCPRGWSILQPTNFWVFVFQKVLGCN